MNTKKLLGTVIGILMFAALIAGATFAWLTFGVTVGNNVLTANTLNFIVNYETGSAVTNLPILDSNFITAEDAAVVSVVLKKNMVGQGANNPDGHASLWLKTTSDTTLTTAGVVRWAICRDPDVETGDDLVNGKQVDDVCGGKAIMNADEPQYNSGVLNSGILTSATLGSSKVIPLLSDARIAENPTQTGSTLVGNCTTESGLSMCTGTTSNTHILEEDGVSYFVYMWLEAEPLKNEHLDEQYDKKGDGSIDYEGGIKRDLYAGYVFASATQLQD